MKKPIADAGMLCPDFKKDVSQVCHKCVLYVHLRGTNPQTGQEIDDWNCAKAWGPILAVDIAKEVRQSAAAVETLRNEFVTQQTSRMAEAAIVARLMVDPPQMQTKLISGVTQ